MGLELCVCPLLVFIVAHCCQGLCVQVYQPARILDSHGVITQWFSEKLKYDSVMLPVIIMTDRDNNNYAFLLLSIPLVHSSNWQKQCSPSSNSFVSLPLNMHIVTAWSVQLHHLFFGYHQSVIRCLWKSIHIQLHFFSCGWKYIEFYRTA